MFKFGWILLFRLDRVSSKLFKYKARSINILFFLFLLNFLPKIPGGKLYDSVLTLATSLHKMITAGNQIQEMSLGFNNDKMSSTPWPPGEQLLSDIKQVLLATIPYFKSRKQKRICLICNSIRKYTGLVHRLPE